MQKKYWISLAVIAVVLAAGILLSNTKAPKQEESTCCKKATNKCTDTKKPASPAESSLDQLSSQFITVPISF